MGWIGSVRCINFRCDFVARTFALIAPFLLVLHRVSCSSKMVPNAPTSNKTHLNMSYGSNGVDRERSLRNNPTRHGCTKFCINCNSWLVLHQVSCSRETVPNAPKLKETHQNVSSGSNGVDWECSLRKIQTWLHTTKFCINYNILACFAPSFAQ